MAAKGIELASAYVSLGAETRDIAKAIDKVFDDFSMQADKAGKEAGRKAGTGFQDEVKKRTRRVGREAGNQFGSAFGSGVGSVGVTSWMSRLGREAKASGNRAGFLAGKAMGAGITAGVATAAVGVSAAIAGIGYALNEGFKRLKTIDQAEFKLRALGKTSKEIAAISKSVTEVVTGTPFAMQEAYGAAVGAIGSGIESTEELQKYLTAIADAAAFGGTSFEEMALIFGQVMNKGKFQAEEMLQLNERQIPVQAWLQKALGKTGAEITKMSKDGKLSIQDLLTATQQGAGGMAQKMGETIQGGIDNMKTAVAKVGASFLAPLFSGTEGASGANTAIGGVTGALKELGEWIDDNQETVIDFWANMAKAALYFAEDVLVTVASTTRALAQLVNVFGDTYAATTRMTAAFQRLIGNGERADELDAEADAAFGWADGLYSAADRADELVDSIGGLRTGVDEWAESAKAAAGRADDAAESVGKLGESVVAARTDAADGIDIPVDVELSAANTAMEGFLAQWSSAVISPQVTPGGPGGGGGGVYNPLTGPVNSDGGGLLETASGLKRRYESMGFSNIGGYNPTVDQPWDEHQTGTAIDVPIPNWQSGGGGGAAVVADALRQPGTQHVIWQQKTYYPDGRVDEMPDRGSPTENHMDHVHIKTFDEGGWWKDGELGINTTGKDELVLNPADLQHLSDNGIDPSSLQHGAAGGAPPGPAGALAPGAQQQGGPNPATEGLIPAMAANTNPVGQGGLSNFLDLGESFVHGLIDTAADLGSMAVSAAAAAGTSGAGAAAGPAASAGIKMAAEAGKRGVSWGYDMAGIWGEALIEQLMPFGAPHWAGTNPMAFMPQGNPFAEFMPKQPGTMGETPGEGTQQEATANTPAGGTPPVQDNTHPGSGAMPGPGATPPLGAPMGGPGGPNMEQVQAMAMDPSTWLSGLFGGTFDQGGVLQPNQLGVNLSKRPEYVLTQSQWKAMQSGGMQVEGRKGETNNFYAQDVAGMFREYTKHNRRQARQYSGRL